MSNFTINHLDKSKKWSFDIGILSSVVVLLLFSILFIYSSGLDSDGLPIQKHGIPEFAKQIFWASTGFVLMLIISLFDYRQLRLLSFIIFGITLFLLILVLLIGSRISGAKSWLGIGPLGIQPSELSKLASIIMLATFLENQGNHPSQSLRVLFMSGLILALPVGLIALQPDFGSASVFTSIMFFMSFFSGASLSLLFFVVLTGLLFIFYLLLPIWNIHISQENLWLGNILNDPKLILTLIIVWCGISIFSYIAHRMANRHKRVFFAFFYFGLATVLALTGSYAARQVIKPYQMERLTTFMDPSRDPQGAGWHITQSLTAIGSGGLKGKGYLKGTQSHLHYLPEQSTDFIFSIILEETGLVGGIIILLAYAMILIRTIMILHRANEPFGSYLAAGIFGVIFFHIIINIGMTIGLLPITGIPLPLLSYGGSSLWSMLAMLGIVMSIGRKHY
jgi:rod shape determining protein RodA